MRPKRVGFLAGVLIWLVGVGCGLPCAARCCEDAHEHEKAPSQAYWHVLTQDRTLATSQSRAKDRLGPVRSVGCEELPAGVAPVAGRVGRGHRLCNGLCAPLRC